MGVPVIFEGTNLKLLPPEGRSDVQPMFTYSNGLHVVSKWVLTVDELAEITETGCVFVSVLSPAPLTPPPIFVGSEKSVRALAADGGGVWKKDGE